MIPDKEFRVVPIRRQAEREKKKRKGRWLAQRGLTFQKKEEERIDFNFLFFHPIAETHYTLAHTVVFRHALSGFLFKKRSHTLKKISLLERTAIFSSECCYMGTPSACLMEVCTTGVS